MKIQFTEEMPATSTEQFTDLDSRFKDLFESFNEETPPFGAPVAEATNCGYIVDRYGRTVQVTIVLQSDTEEWISDPA